MLVVITENLDKVIPVDASAQVRWVVSFSGFSDDEFQTQLTQSDVVCVFQHTVVTPATFFQQT
jgi:hypothetical protein